MKYLFNSMQTNTCQQTKISKRSSNQTTHATSTFNYSTTSKLHLYKPTKSTQVKQTQPNPRHLTKDVHENNSNSNYQSHHHPPTPLALQPTNRVLSHLSPARTDAKLDRSVLDTKHYQL
uniref:Uncharacterized protein n=1 Tax=Mucochytrium quahogii TaxID=96639 RepID=A0A7S2RZR9_9STRA|mmetsp:Transcript_35599/g.56951  ORF Transcript_35599/g.56951 Transcript_35599/m.56951 type:complete len:119 (+) Transcript_35599:228-584(+)